MFKQILKYGAIAGLIVGIPMIIMTTAMKGHPPTAWAMAIGYLTMLIAFTTIFLAIKRKRDVEHGGVIRFWPALGLGLGISVVASIFYVLFWEAALATTGMDFMGAYTETLIEEQKAKGASAEAISALAAEMKAFSVDYANPLYRMPLTFTEIFPIGVLVSLVSAGLLRNSRFLPAQRV
jgi:hypothetical protein